MNITRWKGIPKDTSHIQNTVLNALKGYLLRLGQWFMEVRMKTLWRAIWKIRTKQRRSGHFMHGIGFHGVQYLAS
jgi:hypothetical protein